LPLPAKEKPLDIDDLFALPLAEFTSARNALSKQLKQAGDAEAAEQVRALSKPSVATWAVNQLARREPEAVRSLLNVAARLRSAQERSLKGDRTADELRAAQAEERELIRDLARHAESLLREAGRPASGTTLERVSSLLRAAAVDEPGRTALRAGMLTGDVAVSGFDAFAGMEVGATRGGRTRAGDDLAERRRLKREAAQRRKKLEKQVRDLSARADAAERDADKARREADEAEAVAAERRREADVAAAELAELED
jgi:predicted ribosome quality control (RQC) complex YloA/Tae2 family protein